jgi:TolB protein
MSKKIFSITIAVVLVLGFVALTPASPVYAVLNGMETQVTTDLSNQFDPAIDGDYIVFTDYRSGNKDIYLHDLATGAEVPILATGEDEYLNDISGNLVVCTLATFDDQDILVYDILTGVTTQITDPDNNQFAMRRDPAICGNIVVWQDDRSGHFDIWGYNLSSGAEFLISTGEGTGPALGDQIHPAIHGDTIVWCDYRDPSNPDIYSYQLGDETPQLIPVDDPSNPYFQSSPDIWENYVVFDHASPSDLGNRDVILWNLDTGTWINLTQDSDDLQTRARIDSGRVVWEDSRNGNIDIYTYDISSETVDFVTVDSNMQYLNDISGDRIVWTDLRNVSGEHPGNYDIYMFEILPTIQYTLTVDVIGGGSVALDPQQPTYAPGTVVELTATPDPGWSLYSWSGDLTGTENPTTITMDSDKVVTATFAEGQCAYDDGTLDWIYPTIHGTQYLRQRFLLSDFGFSGHCLVETVRVYWGPATADFAGDIKLRDYDTGELVTAASFAQPASGWEDYDVSGLGFVSEHFYVELWQTAGLGYIGGDTTAPHHCMSERSSNYGETWQLFAYPVEGLYEMDFMIRAVVAPVPDIDVSPLSYDFGDVELGDSSMTIVTVSNVGDVDITVSDISFEVGSSADYSVTSGPTLPTVIIPAQTVDIQVTYSPSAVGASSAILNIYIGDSSEPFVGVSLSGTGVEVAPPPSEQIADILAFFDASVAEGSLAGDGPGSSAAGRRGALRNMIEASGDLIEDGDIESACEQLCDAYQRTDGNARPPDFVAGPAASELASQILVLMESLGCPQCSSS